MSAAGDLAAGKQAFLDWRFDAAEASFRAALAADPDDFEAKVYLGRVLDGQGRLDDAATLFRDALAVEPGHAATHLLLAQTLLAAGHYEEGWAEYEWRYRGEGGQPFPEIDAPRWQGGPLHGRRLLVIGEQGFGDVLQFVRFLPQVKAIGGQVSLAVSAPLLGLLKPMAAIDHIFHDWHRAGAFDCYCPLSSLPGAFGIGANDLPGVVPYLEAEPRRASRWARRLGGGDNGGLRIGLCWAGRPSHPNDRHRSLPFDTLHAHLPKGAILLSLQKGTPAGDCAGTRVLDLSARLYDFAETAAVIAGLDLVVSVDTSVAHLAGALGRPVHVLLPYVPDWRWGRTRAETPWYPTARIFRQDRPGDWTSALAGVFDFA